MTYRITVYTIYIADDIIVVDLLFILLIIQKTESPDLILLILFLIDVVEGLPDIFGGGYDQQGIVRTRKKRQLF